MNKITIDIITFALALGIGLGGIISNAVCGLYKKFQQNRQYRAQKKRLYHPESEDKKSPGTFPQQSCAGPVSPHYQAKQKFNGTTHGY